jgi:AcrR family transcriptional regulator
MPKLWSDTIASHRKDVRDAIFEAAAALVAERGVTSLTMSAIAERVEITRATIYKYFPHADSILRAWHERQIERNLAELVAARDRARDAEQRLGLMLETYARLVHEQHASELATLLHHGDSATRGYRQLRKMLQDAIAEGAKRRRFRKDVSPAELAGFCVHALSGAHTLSSMAAVRRLVSVTIDGLRPPGRAAR